MVKEICVSPGPSSTSCRTGGGISSSRSVQNHDETCHFHSCSSSAVRRQIGVSFSPYLDSEFTNCACTFCDRRKLRHQRRLLLRQGKRVKSENMLLRYGTERKEEGVLKIDILGVCL